MRILLQIIMWNICVFDLSLSFLIVEALEQFFKREPASFYSEKYCHERSMIDECVQFGVWLIVCYACYICRLMSDELPVAREHVAVISREW